MPLTLEELEDIRAEYFAEDVAIELDKMSLWTQDHARAFFENGGIEPVADVSDERATIPRRPRATSVESPGAADMAMRTNVPPLPPHVKLTSDELKQKVPLTRPGEWYKLPFPTTLEQLSASEFGAAWLTRAFHAAGSLPKDDSVTAITRVHVLELQGVEAQGGAGEKAIIDVSYAKGGGGLHTSLFVKSPWRLEVQAKYRMLISCGWGDGDGSELSIYQFYEGLLPVRIPKFYFGDICRETTNYILITEAIDYPPRSRQGQSVPPHAILPKCGKYQDDTLGSVAADYYFAMLRVCARIAAVDKLGRFDDVAGKYVWRAPLSADSAQRRKMMANVAASQAEKLIEFVHAAKGLFTEAQCSAAFLEGFKRQLVEMAPFFTAIGTYLAYDERFIGLNHVNLQIDNAFFWRDEDSALDCGLLDWGAATRVPYTQTFAGMLSGAEADVLVAHEEGMMRCFADEYAACGGPNIDADELLLRFRLMYASMVLGSLQFIEQDVYPELSKSDFASISSRWDPRLMGRWNARCRAIAVICMLNYWQKHDLHGTVMGWAKREGLTGGKYGYPPK